MIMKEAKKRLISILLGLLLFFGIWAWFLLSVNRNILYLQSRLVRDIVDFLIISFSLPFVYSILYQKKYPMKTVLTFLIVEIILYRLTVSFTDAYRLQFLFYQTNLFLGSVIVLLGGFIEIAVTKLLSPIQSYLDGKNLPKFSIPVLSGIIFFIVGYFLIITELYQSLLLID